MSEITVETLKVPDVVAHLRASFATNRTRSLAWREHQLQALKEMIRREESRLLEALRADLGKPALEAYASEVGYLLGEVDHTLKQLRRWVRPEKVRTPMLNFKGTSWVHREPLGVVLIIGPWNYPFQLLLTPLIGAIAAGNCAVLKPSEFAHQSAQLLAELIDHYLDSDCVRLVQGGVPETTRLLEERFDHVFFTGSTAVGRIVYQAAAKHLTPVTLELGGKSPCIVDEQVDIEVAARRITWGKFFNAGQTCVAPDYVLVDKRKEQPLLDALKATIIEFYGADPKQSPDFGRIVSKRHHQRLVKMLDGAEIEAGGQSDQETRYLAPTVVRNVGPDHALMAEEIFGPILPVLPVDDLQTAIRFVTERPKPLALYVFTEDAARARQVLSQTNSGGACVNDTVAHLAVPDLPFGGVGESGLGAYHGKSSFECFSHRKSVLERATWIDPKLRYPPYEGALKWIRKLIG